ncbi:meiotic recombination dmc1 [Zalerion maritima]|uniref:Meiotic recombination dmc1 n=1 Tax=Zalerion maritima TaxID=339359 RepID=A0AAD5RM11_9PEZI|nr:meiotic recombination dmc1 [Zalerion maritima]
MVHAAQIAAAAASSTPIPLPSPPSMSYTEVELPFYFTPIPNHRAKLLPPNKEFQCRTWLDAKISSVSRRFLRKLGGPEAVQAGEATTRRPFQSIDEVCHSLDEIVNFLWTTATPAIEVPYMLSVADEFIKYAKDFPPSPGPTFQHLHKLDFCFASMLAGKNLNTNVPLPAKDFLTATDMVRLKGIVERTRLEVVPLFGYLDMDENDDDGTTAVDGNYDDKDDDIADANSYTTYDDDGYDGLYKPSDTVCAQADIEQMQTPRPSTATDDSDLEPEDDILAGAVPRPGRRQSLAQSLPGRRPPRRWDEDEEDGYVAFEVGRVYEKTVMQLGKCLGWGTMQ